MSLADGKEKERERSSVTGVQESVDACEHGRRGGDNSP